MTYEYKQDGNALTDPPVMLGWRDYAAMFGIFGSVPGADLSDQHLTNYQALVVTLHNTWETNKASAHANGELITSLRKRLKKIKKALKS